MHEPNPMNTHGHIPDSEITAVRAASPIEIVVGAYAELRPTGPGSLMGLCPFHPEQTPSFHVSPQRGLFHCFGCRQGGDVFTFLQRIEHLDFPDAVTLAAHRSGYRLRYEGGGTSTMKRRGTRARLVAANAAAAEFYRQRLHTDSEAAAARQYLTERNFDARIIDAFGVGFAPMGWDELTKHLMRLGFTLPELEAAGLSRQGRRGPIDRFHARLLWPIRNASGEVLGFGARRVFDHDRVEAKYLNTPETRLYSKSRVLFGIDQARRAIGDTHQAVVVEGYTDVMAMHAAGITNAVASCGNAFGEHHHYTLRRMLADHQRWRTEIVYCFDGDAAGRKAATAALAHVKATPGRSSVAIAPEGADPCDLRQRSGDEGLHELILSRTALIEYVLRAALSEHDITTVEGRIAATHHGATVLQQLHDPITRSEYTRQLADWTGVDPDAALELVGAIEPPPSSAPTDAHEDQSPARTRWQRTALQTALQFPVLAAAHGFDELPRETFEQPRHARLHASIIDLGGTRSAPADVNEWITNVMERLGSDPGLATELAVPPLTIPGSHPDLYLRAVFVMVVAQHYETRVQTLRRQLDSVSPADQPEVHHRLSHEISYAEQRRHAILADHAKRRAETSGREELSAVADIRPSPRRSAGDSVNRSRRPRL
ncbi:DNA primase [Nocardia takedensis]